MTKQLANIFLVLFLSVFICYTSNAQAFVDSALVVSNDSIILVSDSTLVQVSDSLFSDTTELAELDTVYYSLYGSIINKLDSNNVSFWRYNISNPEVKLNHYDSTLNNLYLDHPAYDFSINNNYLGNTGLATKSNLYFESHPDTKYLFSQPYSAYYFFANNANYYNVIKPFTKFKVSISTKDEQNVNLLHTQNVNQYLNFFAHFKSATGLGVYSSQKSRNNAAIFGFSFNKKWMSTHAGVVFNKIDVEESGGVIDSRLITDTILEPASVGNRITNGETIIKNRQLFLDQKVGFVKARYKDSSGYGGYWFSLQYNYQWDKSFKQYSHTTDLYSNPLTISNSNYYMNNYSGVAATFDSSSYISHQHVVRFNIEEIPGKYPGFGAYGGLGIDFSSYYYFNKDSLFNNSKENKFSDTYFEVGIHRLRSKYVKFTGKYKVYYAGRRQGDMEMGGTLFQDFGKNKWTTILSFQGDVIRKTPDYFYQEYYSNHFRWNNNFEAPIITTMKAELNMPVLNTSIGWRNSLSTNYVYFNNESVPEQYSDAINVFDVYLKNRLNFWKFNLVTQLFYQNSGNIDIIPVPDLSYYGALLFESPVKFKSTGGLMKIQLGVDALYWSQFYAQEYIPSLSTFTNQNVQQTGDYPFIGAFTSIEIKRMRIYLRLEHLNSKYSDRNFFMSPGYPAREFSMRYGLVWTFYN